MGGPHCDHSPSSLICSHYPYQRLKIKNKDRESDGDSERQPEKDNRGVKERGTKRLSDLHACGCVLTAIGPLFGCGSVGGGDAGV